MKQIWLNEYVLEHEQYVFCRSISPMWACDVNSSEFRQFNRSLIDTFLALEIAAYVLCLVNSLICYTTYNRSDFKGRSIPLFLKSKYVINLTFLSFILPARILSFRTGSRAPSVPSVSVCYIFIFLANCFSTAANWAEVVAIFYRFLKSTLPLATIVFFRNNVSAYTATVSVLMLGICTNLGDLTHPAAKGCVYMGRLRCGWKSAREGGMLHLTVTFWIPFAICLSLAGWMFCVVKTSSKNVKHRNPVYSRTYDFTTISTVIFIVTSMPYCVFRTFFSHQDARQCDRLINHDILHNVLLIVRHSYFCVDWLLFLIISPFFRERCVCVLRYGLSGFWSVSEIRSEVRRRATSLF